MRLPPLRGQTRRMINPETIAKRFAPVGAWTCPRFLWEIWLFHLEGGTVPPYYALQFLPFINKGVNRLCISIDFVLNKTLTKKD